MRPGVEEQPAKYPLKVLLVEDSADDAIFTIDALQAGMYAPFWKRVETASEMKQALVETKWELIVADHRLPRFSALEAFEIYRQFELDIPFIIVSGVISEEAAVAAMRAGVHDYLNKGSLARLVPAVHRELQEAESRRERKRAEAALSTAYAELAAIQASAPMLMLLVDGELRVERANEFAARFAGRGVDEMMGLFPGSSIGCLNALADPAGCNRGPTCSLCMLCRTVLDTVRTGTRHDSVEAWLPVSTGGERQERCLLLSTAPMQNGTGRKALVCAQDISELKQAELRVRDLNRDLDRQLVELQRASAEKDVLLREVQHRVKNNLQVISSMLSLEARRLGKGDALKVLENNRDRIRSMAMIHEKICYSQDLARIDFGEYVRSLAGYFMSSYSSDESAIQLSIDVDLELEMDDAIPCGLIIQELLSNSIKYAFPDGTGEISIQFHHAEGELRLRYRDSGPGLLPGVDPCNPESLGLQLVNDLVSQLQGRIAYQNSNGATFTMRFKSAQERRVSSH